jgi:hypothetical protein
MRVMVLHTADESQMGGLGEPTPEMVAAFKAMDVFTEELVKAGVFVAAAGLKPSAQSKRVEFDGRSSRGKVVDGPFAEAREMVAGFSIWEVKDLDEAMAWAMKAPVVPGMSGAMEIRPFYEAADLAGFATPEEIEMGRRPGERGKLGVA